MPKGEGYTSSNPTTKYLMAGKGRGTSSVKVGGDKGIFGGPKADASHKPYRLGSGKKLSSGRSM